MTPLPGTAAKVLALALDDAAHDGERMAAALKFVTVLRSHGIEVGQLVIAGPGESALPSWRTHRMPFGKHKGVPLREIDDAYLLWLAGRSGLREPLRTYLRWEINLRQRAAS